MTYATDIFINACIGSLLGTLLANMLINAWTDENETIEEEEV